MRYSIIHHEVKKQFGLTVSEYLVCDSIYQLSYKAPFKGEFSYIAEHLDLSDKTTWRARDTLLMKKLIEEVDGGYKATELWVDAVVEAKRQPDKMSAPPDKMSGQTGQNVQHTISKEYKELIITPVSDETTPQKKPKSNLEGFDSWWESYPRKANRVGASAEWRKLSPAERVLAIAHNLVRPWPESKFIPMPDRFLRDRRWEDEITSKKINSYG